jgi:hypothetical protein
LNGPESIMKILLDTNVLVSAAELGEVIGADPETINNWIRHRIISRAPIGGRQLARHRLFTTEEVYKAALKHELVKLRIPPSPASRAVNELWKEWDKEKTFDGKTLYAVLLPGGDSWAASLWWKNLSGGPLYRIGKRPTSKLLEEMELPKQAFAMIPMTDVLGDVTNKLQKLLSDTKRHKTKDARS